MHKPETLGRLVQWSVELSEFDIDYHPQGAIKGQAMADFIAECTHMSKGEVQEQKEQPGEAEATQEIGMLYVDGSSTIRFARGGVILVTS